LTGALYRLLAWLSPNFPTGAFSYSHGLETAAEAGAVHDRASLEAWVRAIVEHGGGRIDADILCSAYRAAAAGDTAALAEVNVRGVAYRATAELALESAQQGAAFLAAYDAAWATKKEHSSAGARRSQPKALPLDRGGLGGGDLSTQQAANSPPPLPSPIKGEGDFACHSAMFGAAAARAGIALEDALLGYLQAFASNLIAAGLRLGIIGQTDGQRILAALEPVVACAAKAAIDRAPEDFGSATFAADLVSVAHETQYSRLFRS
jgi:urease accessory protein